MLVCVSLLVVKETLHISVRCTFSFLPIVGNESTFRYELVNTRVGSSVTRSSHFTGAIQNVLHRQIDFIAQSLSRNLDAVSESGQRAVSPTATTVLGNVLIERVRQVADSVNVAPSKGSRQVVRLDVFVRKWARVSVADLVALQNLKLIEALRLSDRTGAAQKREDSNR